MSINVFKIELSFLSNKSNIMVLYPFLLDYSKFSQIKKPVHINKKSVYIYNESM